VIASVPKVQLAFHVSAPDIAALPTLALYWVMRPVLASYWKASESTEPKVMPMGSLKPLYDVAVTGFCWLVMEEETVLTRPSPSGA
jgi:hypothetical protein